MKEKIKENKTKIIGWYNKSSDHFLCFKCFTEMNESGKEKYKPVEEKSLENDIYTCDKCGRKFEVCSKRRTMVEEIKKIRETKCICKSCGNIWFYGKEDVSKSKANAVGNLGKACMCCSGCWPALLIPEHKVIDFNKCPKCGSRAVEKKIIVHNV